MRAMSTGLGVPPYSVDRAAVMAETETISRHPDFGEALRRYAAAGLDRFEAEPRAAKMICQVARYTLALAVLHLESTGGPDGVGATAARLRVMLTKGDFAAAGWVKNAVRVFQRAGYLAQRPSGRDRRLKRVAPSDEMIKIAREALAPMLHAIECVAPLPLPAARLAYVEGFIGAAASHTIVPYLTDGFTPLEAFPEIRVLLLHDYAFILLCHLIRTMRRTPDGAMVAEAPSLALSRRFGMPRSQVRNLLAVARHAGWIEAVGRGGHEVTLSPQFADLCERWVAHDLACWSRVARAASRDLGVTR
jgi:hypothetical protein